MKISAIAIGCAADYLCTRLFMLAVLLVLLDPGSSTTLPYERVSPGLLDAFCASWGVFFTGLGGWLAARRAPQAPLLNAAMVGLVSLVISHLSQGWHPSNVGLPLYLVGTFTVVPVAVTGGYLAKISAKG
jgi:hypothetical protein